MIVSDTGQARVFLIYIIFGMMCVALYDLFYVLSKRYGKTKLLLNLFDVCYLASTFCLLLFAGVRFNLGALRYYQIFGLLAGICFHRGLFSKMEKKLFDLLLTLGGKITRFAVRLLWRPVSFLLRGVFSLIDFIEDRLIFMCHKLNNRAKKVKTKSCKKKKTVKKRVKLI